MRWWRVPRTLPLSHSLWSGHRHWNDPLFLVDGVHHGYGELFLSDECCVDRSGLVSSAVMCYDYAV